MSKDLDHSQPENSACYQALTKAKRIVLIRLPKEMQAANLHGLKLKYRSTGDFCEFKLDPEAIGHYSLRRATVQKAPVCMAIPNHKKTGSWTVEQPFGEVWEVRREVKVPATVRRSIRPDSLQRDAYAERVSPIEQPPLPERRTSFWQVSRK